MRTNLDDNTRIVRDVPDARARGGLSLTAVLTGIVVAVGAMAVISALVTVAGYLLDTTPELSSDEGVYRAGIALAAGAIAIQFLAYLWGGYTAGRMARGAGVLNGLLVPLVVLLFGAAAFALGDVMGSGAEVTFGALDGRLPIDRDVVVDAGIVFGVGSVVAMLLGGTLGGAMGQRWHTRLEEHELASVMVEDRVGAPAGDRMLTRTDTDDDLTPAPLAIADRPARVDESVRILDERREAGQEVIDLRASDPSEPLESEIERVRMRH